MAGGSTIGVVQVVLSARDDSLAREFRKATKQIESFKGAAETAFKVVMGTELTRKAIRGLSELVDYMTLTTDEAKKMGLVLGDDTRQRLIIAETAFKQMGHAIDGIRVIIADAAAPSLTAFARLITDATTTSEDMRTTVAELDHGIENVAVVIISLAQGIAGLFLLIAVPVQAVAVAISGLIESLIEVGYWLDGIGNTAEQSFKMTKNTISGLESSINALQKVGSGSWSDKFRDEMSKVRNEINHTAATAITASELTALDRASEERQRVLADKRAMYWAQVDQDQQVADAKEARRLAEATKKYADAADEREAIWKKEQQDRAIALQLDPKARAEFVGRASEDPRVKYEKDVADAIQAGKTMVEAMKLAKESQARDESVKMPGADVRVLYEAEVDRLVSENRRQNRLADEAQTRQYQETEMQGYADFFGNLATLTAESAKKNEAMFYVNKAMMMAQAEINSWMAYSNVMGNVMLGLTVGPMMQQVMAYTALAAGQVAVAQIASQQPAGRANGGPVSRGGLYQVNERGPEILSIGDKSFLMMGNKDGSVHANGPGRGGSGVTVNVHNAPGTTARVEQSGTPDAPSIEVIIERVDRAIADGVRSGSGSTARAVQSTYGLNRARGSV